MNTVGASLIEFRLITIRYGVVLLSQSFCGRSL